MNLFVFIAIYILPSMLLAGIFAPKLGKLIQRLIEYLLNKVSRYSNWGFYNGLCG